MEKPEFIELNVPLAPYTSFKIGGPADFFAIVTNFFELKKAVEFSLDKEIPFFVLGKGTNLLVSDAGFKGLVLKLGGELAKAMVEGRFIVAGGGSQLALASSLAYRHSLSGLEWAAGIPGTVGGAIKMNAGAHGFSISDCLIDAAVYDIEKGELIRLKRTDIKLAYRTSSINEKQVILEARFGLREENQQKIRKLMDSMFSERKKTQPLQARTAGSVFKNPPSMHAGKLIEEAGLKGIRVGGAKVSEKHANFIVNEGDATASDIYNLIKKIQQEVYEKFKVKLEPEIVFLGDFD